MSYKSDTPHTYTLSLHELFRSPPAPAAAARAVADAPGVAAPAAAAAPRSAAGARVDRKSTRLNSSHVAISYAVFCLKKKITDKIYLVSDRKIYTIELLCMPHTH